MRCTRESVGKLEIDVLVQTVASIYSSHDKHRSLWDVWCHALHHAAAVAEEIRKASSTNLDLGKVKQEIADLALWVFTMLAKLRGPLGSSTPNQPPRDWLVKISVTASNLMWNRYPAICPWCYCATHPEEASSMSAASLYSPCCCDALQIDKSKKVKTELRTRALRTRRLANQNVGLKPLSLDGWENMIVQLYRDRLKRLLL